MKNKAKEHKNTDTSFKKSIRVCCPLFNIAMASVTNNLSLSTDKDDKL